MTDETRQRIIAATNELFRRRGYNGTSLAAIGGAAEATTGSIYHFFPGGKVELAEAVIVETGGAYRDLFLLIAAGATDPVAAVRDVFSGAAATLEADDYVDICPIGTVAREVASENERLRMAAELAIGSWVEAVTGLLVEAGVERREAEPVATSVVSLLEGAFVLARTKRDAAIVERAGGHAARLVAGALADRVAPSSPARRDRRR